MEITTDLKRADVFKLNVLVATRSKGTYYYVFGIAVFVLLFSFYESGLPSSLIDWIIVLVIAASSGMLGAILTFVINIFCLLLSSKQSNGVLGKHEYQLSEKGLFEKTEANETLTKWTGILSIKTYKNFLLIQIAPGLFHIIPSRNFPNLKQYENFANAARKFWENA